MRISSVCEKDGEIDRKQEVGTDGEEEREEKRKRHK